MASENDTPDTTTDNLSDTPGSRSGDAADSSGAASSSAAARAGTSGDPRPEDPVAPPASKAAARKRAPRKSAAARATAADEAATVGPEALPDADSDQPAPSADRGGDAAADAADDAATKPRRARKATAKAAKVAAKRTSRHIVAGPEGSSDAYSASEAGAISGFQTELDVLTETFPEPPPAGSLVDVDALRFDALEIEAADTKDSDDTDDTDDTSDTGDTGDTDEAAPPDRLQQPSQGGEPAAYGPLFQPPTPRRRRRASAAAAAPVAPVEDDDAASDAETLADTQTTDTTDSDDTEADTDTDADQGSDSPRRRRRRGGKGRRSRSTSATPLDDAVARESGDDAGLEDDAPPDTDAEPAGEKGDTQTSRRRTRRRRRSGGSDSDGQDAPGVTIKVRESRRDEVTALKGSTRLEAKKQRRREGREAGRRRTIITEAEFLARRESVERVMVVRRLGDRTQIGVLEDGVLVEHYISRETTVSMAGNIYLGRVQNVLPSMEAAFVDIGKGRNAVLYAGEVNWDAAGLESNQAKRIENALSSGESVLAQVTKDPIGHKGARLTSQISLPGRYLVYVPNSSMTGISRKLPDTERSRLKKILKDVLPESAGVIVRTAAEGASEEELRADVERLTQTWADITAKSEAATGGGKKKAKSGSAPLLLHGEPDLTVRVIRDIFNEDVASLVVAGEQAWQEVSEYVDSVAPDLADRVTRWTSDEDLFTHYRVDEQIAKAMDRKVWLPSGGSLVIDRTEAMTVVDVNTGKFIGSGGNLEETVTKNNLEAAEEIVRQLRLRDVGGIIVIDFIDMVLESNRELVVRRLLECLGRDRTKHQVAEVTSLGLVQMTRKRVGSGLIEVFSETCEVCGGRGIIVHADPVDRSTNGTDAGDQASGPARSAARGRSRGRASEPVPAARSSGPTPAQIAAAAHAAAVKTAVAVGDTDGARAAAAASGDGMPRERIPGEGIPGENLVLEGGLERVALQDEPAEVVAEMDGIEPEASGSLEPEASGSLEPEASGSLEPEASGPLEPAPSSGKLAELDEREPRAQQETSSSAAMDDEAPQEAVAAPAAQASNGRPRRRRGRVVAPAGPPPQRADGDLGGTGDDR